MRAPTFPLSASLCSRVLYSTLRLHYLEELDIPPGSAARYLITRLIDCVKVAAGFPSAAPSYRGTLSDQFLVANFGAGFANSGLWYRHATVATLFRALIFAATDGRIRLSDGDVYSLFGKQVGVAGGSGSFVLDAAALERLCNLSAASLLAVFKGKSGSSSSSGHVRGTPLLLPPDEDVLSAAAAAAAAQAQAGHAGVNPVETLIPKMHRLTRVCFLRTGHSLADAD